MFRLVAALLSVLGCAVIAEVSVLAIMQSTALVSELPSGLRSYVRKIARKGFIRLIQFDPSCARYDSQLGYLLAPGTCEFKGPEFQHQVEINRLGLRDDEESLLAPEIVVLGDSFAMGWGVDGHETFAQLLESRSGLRVLNAGMSSYGTAREMKLLGRLDRSRLRLIVLQYFNNDFGENARLFHDGRLLTMSELEYEEKSSAHMRVTQGYYPGKVIGTAFRLGLRSATARIWPAPPVATGVGEGRAFLHAVATGCACDVGGARILAFEVPELYARPGRSFIEEVRSALHSGEYAQLAGKLQLVDPRAVLMREHYYPLDGHLNSLGHEAVANLIWESMDFEAR